MKRLTPEQQTELERLQDEARQAFGVAYRAAEKAEALIAMSDQDREAAWVMVNEMYRDDNNRPDTGTPEGLWDVIDQYMETNREWWTTVQEAVDHSRHGRYGDAVTALEQVADDDHTLEEALQDAGLNEDGTPQMNDGGGGAS